METLKKDIETFYKKNKIDIEVIEILEGLQVDTIKTIIFDYTDKTIKKIEKLTPALCLYLKKDKINIKQDNKSGALLFEIPKEKRAFLTFEELDETTDKSGGLVVNFGLDTIKKNVFVDLTKTPHLLIAGQTGSGKSVLLNSILTQLFFNYSPDELETILIDIKQVELSIYENIPHLLRKPLTTYEDAKEAFYTILDDINARYKKLKETHTRNIKEYNEKSGEPLKYKIIVIDELAELFLIENKSKLSKAINGGERLEDLITRAAQIGRACGVHLILATQRPSSDVITGLIKANIPARVALSVASGIDSRIILDEKGAENLTGKGDALLKLTGEDVKRFQTPFIDDTTQLLLIDKIIEKWGNNKNIIEEQEETPKDKKTTFLNVFVNIYNDVNFNNTINNLIGYIKTEEARKKIFALVGENITDFDTVAAYSEAVADFERVYKVKETPTPTQYEKQKRTIAGLSVPAFFLACIVGICDGLGGKRKRR